MVSPFASNVPSPPLSPTRCANVEDGTRVKKNGLFAVGKKICPSYTLLLFIEDSEVAVLVPTQPWYSPGTYNFGYVTVLPSSGRTTILLVTGNLATNSLVVRIPPHAPETPESSGFIDPPIPPKTRKVVPPYVLVLTPSNVTGKMISLDLWLSARNKSS